MRPPKLVLPSLPEHWTPDQALAAFDLIEMLRDQIWLAYGPDIQRALRVDLRPRHRPRRPSDPPF